MDAKEWYCIRIGVTEPYKTTQINTDFMCDLMQEYAEHYHTSQTMPSEGMLIGFFKWLNNFEKLEYTEKGISFYVNKYLFLTKD